MNIPSAVILLSLFALPIIGQDTGAQKEMSCPMHETHGQHSHDALVESHGDQAMGFRHDKTTHHFRMAVDGGSIEVSAHDPADATQMKLIRSHLTRIAVSFGEGDFSTPMFVHDGIPPGVTTMKLMKSDIHYKYEEMPSGARVRISTDAPIAVAAIHDFLRFQITDHHTGDSLEVAQQ